MKISGHGAKSVRFEVGAWYDADTRQIHLTIPCHPRFHTTVSNDPKSVRYHPNMYRKLQEVLKEAGRWAA
jgi:hypothetical protein